jgi:hypothetical protein
MLEPLIYPVTYLYPGLAVNGSDDTAMIKTQDITKFRGRHSYIMPNLNRSASFRID